MLPESPHLDFLATGGVRIRGTRVGLEHLLFEYRRGVSQEELSIIFPTVTPQQAAAVVAYYEQHTSAVDQYLMTSAKHAEELAQKLKDRPLNAAELRLRDIAAHRAHS